MKLLPIIVGMMVIGLFQISNTRAGIKRFANQFNDDKVSPVIVRSTIEKYMCTKKTFMPAGYEDRIKLPYYYFLGLFVVSFILLLLASKISRKCIWKRLLAYLLVFPLTFLTLGGLFFFLNTFDHPICNGIKETTLSFFDTMTSMETFSVYELPMYKQFIAIYPQIIKFIKIFAQIAAKLGITTSPIFLLVIGYNLLSKRIVEYTKFVVLSGLTFILCVLTAIQYYQETHVMSYTLVSFAVVLSVLLIMIFVLISFGHFLLLPIVLIHMTSIIIALYRYYFVEIFLLAIPVIVLTVGYVYFFTNGNAVVASAMIYFAISLIVPMRSGMLIVFILIITGLKDD